MKASDYIVEYLIENKITDVFGYPGGMVIHLMDSFSKYQDKITAHVTYNEQGAALAACGYAQVTGKIGVAYATSGPGATNLITGICNAYMDSIPTIFITGQVNSFEQKGDRSIRQRGFQETDIVSMVRSITKYAEKVTDASELRFCLEKAFYEAMNGRKGPVLLDIAMDVTRADIDIHRLNGFTLNKKINKKILSKQNISTIIDIIKERKRPVLLLGNGIDRSQISDDLKKIINELEIPVVSSMIAVDIQANLSNYYGFIGAYGNREANFIVAKSDLVISIGARLDVRQVGAKRENFAPNSMLIRIDIDDGELKYKVHDNEISFHADAIDALNKILKEWEKNKLDYNEWKKICNEIHDKLCGYDNEKYNVYVRKISQYIKSDSIITTDVGQNQVWVAQSFKVKKGQRILFSGGHGTMGYSLPAAIGACIGAGKRVYCFCGDGGLQMNIQEMQMINRERLPITVILFNNNSLGMIRHFQEMYFDGNYYHTTIGRGYENPNFEKISEAYGFRYLKITNIEQVEQIEQTEQTDTDGAMFVEILLNDKTYVFPKLEYGKPNQDQEPLLDRKLYNYLMELGNKI